MIFTTRILLTGLLSLAVIGCYGGEEAFKKDGNKEEKPGSRYERFERGGADALLDREERPTVAARARYKVKVVANSGAVLCRGETDLIILSDFKVDVPKARIRCLSLMINLADMLDFGDQMGQDAKLSSDGYMIYIDKLGKAQFSPARPLILGPIVQNPGKYQDFEKSGAFTVRAPGRDGRGIVSYQGHIAVKVMGINGSYSNEWYDGEFDNIIQWAMKAEGYDDVPVAKSLLFDRLDFYYNTRPIMIPKIVIQGLLSDFLSAAPGENKDLAEMGDEFLGKLKVVIEVSDYEVK